MSSEVYLSPPGVGPGKARRLFVNLNGPDEEPRMVMDGCQESDRSGDKDK